MSRKSSDCRNVEGVRPYTAPAGGWGALHAVARTIRNQMDFAEGSKLLLKNNQPSGFDCPGCAWPDPKHTSAFEFCENGAKAVTWEATKKRVTPEFLSAHTVSELWTWNDHDIEDAGRLTEPVRYDAASDTFVRLSWDDAFVRIGAGLRALPNPNMAEFYTSGRASNEAAFLYQIFVREYGTNNFPDCSNMCHEATSVGLPRSIGIGKGSVSLEDFDHADMILSLGHNPGTNHPRMMSTLREAARRNVPIIVFNPMKERALERFASPQHPVEMATFSDTKIASSYHQVRIGGDIAALKGIMKALLALDRAASGTVLDQEFIDTHTTGIEKLIADLDATDWADIVAISGLAQATLEHVAALYARSNAVIACYGMGLTQNMHGTETVRQLANLLLLRGNIGKPGAGICPLRGHSNVQGDRTVGISEQPSAALLDAIERHFGFAPPREHGHDAVKSIAAIAAGESKALICLGGNLAVAMPDQELTFPAMRKLDLSVHIATKLNRSHLLVGKETILLPCLGRTELDTQASGPQSITVEDSMSMVHISHGKLPPASEHLLSEPAIVAGIAKATLPGTRVDWGKMVVNYDHIRDAIEAVVDGFTDYNKRIREPGGFRLPLPATERRWDTPSGRAQFATFAGLGENAGKLMLTTIRSHDQYNTTIYSLDDRYRGVFGRRDVVFLNTEDMTANSLAHGDLIDVMALDGGDTHVLRGFTAIAYDLPRGSVAAYYPEANVLVPLSRHDKHSGTPSYKAIPIRLARHRETSAVA
jgi:molybdopterin-dependent oxidoreductase alpha subunit